jgi:hypothetical protein
MAAKYQIAKSIKLRGGVQFNVNRYDIKAFAAPTEMATIALTTGANQVDFVGSSSNYRNFNGYQPIGCKIFTSSYRRQLD